MEEKVLAQGTPIQFTKRLFAIVIIIILVIFLTQFSIQYIGYSSCEKIVYLGVNYGWHKCNEAPIDGCSKHWEYDSAIECAIGSIKESLPITGSISLGLILISILLHFSLHSIVLTVTDKRVYGRAAFGKRVDIPMDSISAFSSSWPKGISVASSSGRISFLMLKNRDEIYKCVSDLMIERQSKVSAAPVTTAPQAAPSSATKELKNYKDLLDTGVITQEEFDAKKKQLLGL